MISGGTRRSIHGGVGPKNREHEGAYRRTADELLELNVTMKQMLNETDSQKSWRTQYPRWV